MKKLRFTNGYAIIVIGIRERASEYHEEQNIYHVKVVFKTAIAIKRFAEMVGEFVFPKEKKERLLELKKSGETVEFYTKMDFEDLAMLHQPLWYVQGGISYDYMNTYEDYYIHTIIPTTRESLKNSLKNKEFKDYYNNYHIGSTADGERFKDFVDYIIKSKNVISK